jgi:hypothetical protein
MMNDCWIWTGPLTKDGYGRSNVKENGKWRRVYTHRAAYIATHGPTVLPLDHLCWNRACYNPRHMEPVTTRVNTQRADTGKRMRDKTHCPQRHPYAGANLYTDRQGHRHCVICKNEAHLRWYRKNDGAAYARHWRESRPA